MTQHKKDLGYNTAEINFSPNTMSGLFDTDGSIYIGIDKSGEMKKKYTVELSLPQAIENRDLVDSLLHTFGFGRINNTFAKDNHQAKVTFRINLAEFSKPENCSTHFTPLSTGKLRDFLIAEKILNHRVHKYLSFDELNQNTDLKCEDIFISMSEIQALSKEEKRKAGTIACLHLRYNTTPKLKLSIKNPEEINSEVKEEISSLKPEDSTYSIGMRLGEYFLRGVNKQVEAHDKKLRDLQDILPEDYLVGLYIGDGSLEFQLSFDEERVQCGFNFTVTLSEDSQSTLVALQNKFRGEGKINPTSPACTAYRYNLRNKSALKEYLIPLLDKYPLTYSKKMQLNIFKEAMDLADRQAYRTKEGAYEMIDRWYEISLYKKGSRETSVEDMRKAADSYLGHIQRKIE